MKISLCLLMSVFTGTMVMAQSMSYKKIMSEKDEIDLEVFLANLKDFQEFNQEFSNVYYQIGKVELANFSNLDPIVDRVSSRQYVYNCKTNFGLAKNFLDPKELAKNPEWYDVPAATGKDSIEALVVNMMDKEYEASITYADAYEKLIFHYDKAVTHYLKAREEFITINTSAENLRQLFLQTDESLKLAIREVGVSFDSSMYHLKYYRETYQLLPHNKKRQVIVNYNRIDHFRMNGITPTNFLADFIDVWDYKRWSEEFLNLIKVEVDGLQDEIRTAYQFFQNANNKLVEGRECTQVTIDDRRFQRIINLVTKYDNQSVLIDIFNYIVSKLDYGNRLNYERNCNTSGNSLTDDFLSRKARVYQNIFSSFVEADSLDNSILTSGHRQDSFEWFFSEMMSGTSGSVDFAKDQQLENKRAFRNEVVKLAQLSVKQKFQEDSISQVFNQVENLLVAEQNLEIADGLVVVSSLKISDNLELLATKKGEVSKIMGVQKKDKGYVILWEQPSYKNLDIQFSKTVSDSSFVVGGASWIKHIDYSGLNKNTITLKSSDSIVYASYNELQGSLWVVQAGDKTHTFTTIGSNGKITSSKSLELSGDFLNMWSQEGKLWFFTSTNESEKTVVTASIFDNSTKEITETIAYPFSYLMSDPLLIKNDNESITLLAKNSLNKNEVLYLLLDYKGTIHYEEIF